MGNGGSRAAVSLDALERLAEPVVRAAGMDLEAVELIPAGRRRLLRVMVDAQDGADLDDMALVSQALSAELDAAGIMGETPVHAGGHVPRRGQAAHQAAALAAGRGPHGQGPAHRARAPRSCAADDRGGARVAQVVFGRVIAADDDGVVVDVEG